MTVFAPANDAFHGAFDKVERGYLEGGFGAEGVGRIFSGSILLGVGERDSVGWSDTWGDKEQKGAFLRSRVAISGSLLISVQAVSGLDLVVEASADYKLAVNGTAVQAVDIFASNGESDLS